MKSQHLEEPNALQQLRDNPTSRRAFLKTMGAAGLGLAAISLLDGCGGGNDNNGGGGGVSLISFPLQNEFPGTNDQKIFNYALSLEYLESDLYRQALNLASGRAITAPLGSFDSYTLQASSSGLSGKRAQDGFFYLKELAFVEPAHAQFLQAALGSVAVSPNPEGYTFGGTLDTTDPTLLQILTAVLALEENGVRAYLGAGQYFQNLQNLQNATTLYTVEARHASAVNYILGKDVGPYTIAPDSLIVAPSAPTSTSAGVSINTFEHFRTPQTVLSIAQKYIV